MLISVTPRIIITFLTLIVTLTRAYGQIGFGTTMPDSSAIVHIQDTAKGLLIPRMTAIQRNNIHNPAEGLMVYQNDGEKGFWFYNGLQWLNFERNYKSVLHLSGDITDAEAAKKIATEVGPNTQEIQVNNCSELTTLDLPMLSSVSKVYINNNPRLQSINLGSLQIVDAGLGISGCPALSTLNLPLLETVREYFSIIGSGIVNLNMESLKKVDGDIYISKCVQLSTINIPLLEILNGTFILTDNSFVNLNAPLLKRADQVIDISGNPNLLSISLPQFTGPSGRPLSLFKVTANRKLLSVDVPLLTHADSIIIDQNKKCTAVNFPLLNSVTGLKLKNDSSLAIISFPALASVTRKIEITDDSFVTRLGAQVLSFPALSSAGGISITKGLAAPSLIFPALSIIGSFNVSSTLNLSSISLPLLTAATENFSVVGNYGLTAIASPALISTPYLFINSNTGLRTLDVPALTSVGRISFSYNDSCSLLNFPSLTSITDPGQTLNITWCPSLAGISMPVLSVLNNNGIAFGRNQLPSSQINAWLSKLVSLSVTGKTINTLYQSPLAPPTAQGITDKATLQANGNTVYTD